MTTLATARNALDASTTRDERRGYSIDMKRVVIAYMAETVIVLASLWGAWLFARMYGHNDIWQMQMMMLAPLGYAVIEFCRVPLAISARAHGSLFVRIVALIGVLCASGVTVKSMSQLGEIMFRPRLFDVVHAQETLESTQAAQAIVIKHIAAADALVDSRRAALATLEDRAKSAGQQLITLPKDQCAPTTWYGKDGEQHRGQSCKTDTRITAMRDDLKATLTARDDGARLLEQAVATRNTLDHAAVDRAVADAAKDHREALLQSQLHSFAGMIFGVGPTEVTDAQINQFLRIFVFLPAIFVAFASSFVAFTAVHKVKPALIPFESEGADYLLTPLYQSVMRDALEQAVGKHRDAAAKLGEEVVS